MSWLSDRAAGRFCSEWGTTDDTALGFVVEGLAVVVVTCRGPQRATRKAEQWASRCGLHYRDNSSGFVCCSDDFRLGLIEEPLDDGWYLGGLERLLTFI